MKFPLVTVILPVYNGEKYLREAIDSILVQSYHNFELLVMEDGSTDRSRNIITSYKDKRIRGHFSSKNIGLVKQLNKGITLAEGKYIARMDADDIAHPDRFENQVRLMESKKNVGVCGTYAEVLSENGDHLKTWKMPQDHDDIKAELLVGAVLCHPSVMIRSKVLKEYQITYSEKWTHVEDYEFWLKLINITEFYVLRKPLLSYRIHESNVSKLHKHSQNESMKKLKKLQIQKNANFDSHDDNLILSFLNGEWNAVDWKKIGKAWENLHNRLSTHGYNKKSLSKLYSKRLFYFVYERKIKSFRQKIMFIELNKFYIKDWSLKQLLYFIIK